MNETAAVAGPAPTSALFSAPAATFAGTNVGGIPDGLSPCWNPGVGAPRNVTFNASGLSGSPTSVDISMTFGGPVHTFIGDVTAVLIAPNGASHSIFGRTLSTTATAFGDSSDLAGPYIFSNNAPAPPNGGWWQAATAAGAAVAMPTGTYRTTNSGGAGATNPQPATDMNAAFAGVPDANGMWTLRLNDGCAADTGAIAAATLTIEAGPAVVNDAPFDFDGDDKTDIAIFRPTPREWWINRSSNGSTFAAQFGGAGDLIVPSDFTGDGKADIGVWRPSTGEWFILRSEDFSFFSFPFGTNGDMPRPGDYDADGKADPAVFRPSNTTWYIRRSTDSGTTIQAFGTAGDIPVPSDYDGDGRDDIAIFRPSLGQWWLNRSTAGVLAVTFGVATDKPVQGDYTGDGKSDIAIWRPSTGVWFILRSEDLSFFSVPFGLNTDVPAPGDYDGDGRFDVTVFRPSNSTWYSQRTTAGSLIAQFGISTDRPVPNAFVP